MKLKRSTFVAVAALVALAAGFVPLASHTALFLAPFAQAQNIGMRTVSGIVVNTSSDPVPGATVFLKNTKTKSIRSYTSSQNGRFYFAQVDMTVDYELWAEKSGKKSDVKTVSSWDTRKNFETILKMK